jgi:hypothetical protein
MHVGNQGIVCEAYQVPNAIHYKIHARAVIDIVFNIAIIGGRLFGCPSLSRLSALKIIIQRYIAVDP